MPEQWLVTWLIWMQSKQLKDEKFDALNQDKNLPLTCYPLIPTPVEVKCDIIWLKLKLCIRVPYDIINNYALWGWVSLPEAATQAVDYERPISEIERKRSSYLRMFALTQHSRGWWPLSLLGSKKADEYIRYSTRQRCQSHIHRPQCSYIEDQLVYHSKWDT